MFLFFRVQYRSLSSDHIKTEERQDSHIEFPLPLRARVIIQTVDFCARRLFLMDIAINGKHNGISSHLGPSLHPVKLPAVSAEEKKDGDQDDPNARRASVLDQRALREDDTKLMRDERITTITQSYHDILKSVGEDPSRQGKIASLQGRIIILHSAGLLKTPKRAAEVRRHLDH
jgi:hypothetical protein